jgi:hypothetical protein
MDRGYAGTIAHDADVDVYEFTVPPAPYGGYAVVSLTGVDADASVNLEVRAAVDNSIVVDEWSYTPGESVYVWFTAAPDQTFRAFVTWAWNEPGAYTFTAEWFPAPDCYEPNDTRAQAKWIPVGESIQAFLLGGRVAADVIDEAFDDWYRVWLEPGAVEVTLRDVPAQIAPELALYDAQGMQIASDWGGDGEGLTLTADVAAGEYAILVGRNWSGATEGWGIDALPEHLGAPYSLTVDQ